MSDFPSSEKLVMKMGISLNIVKKHYESIYKRETRSMTDSEEETKQKLGKFKS